MSRKKTIIVAAFLCLLGILTYTIWLNSKPVKIVEVFNQPMIMDVVVENFPVTDRGKIKWWQDNEGKIFDAFHIQELENKNHIHYITVWDIGSGFEPYNDKQSTFLDFKSNEQICFEQKLDNRNCIQKNNLLTILKPLKGNVSYTTDGAAYHEKNGALVKDK